MKKLFLFFILTSFYSFSQDSLQTSISKVQVKSDKILFRGIENEIFINVPNPETLFASTVGLIIRDGRFFITPSVGIELKLNLTFKNTDGKLITEYHYFKIKNLPSPIGTLNNEYATKGYLEFKKDELKDAEVGIKMVDFPINFNIKITSFLITCNGKKVKVEGNKLNEEAFNFLKKIKKNSTIIISEIRYQIPNSARAKSIKPIQIKIID